MAPDLPHTQQQRLAFALCALVLGAIAMGVSPIFVRLADVGPYASAFWRTFLALPFLWAWARIEDRTQNTATLPINAPVLLAGLFFCGDLFFWHLSILGTSIANATFLATTAPIWVVFATWLFTRYRRMQKAGLQTEETIGWHTLLGLGFCMLGGFALLGQSYGFAPGRLKGDIEGLITAIFFGAYILAVRRARLQLGAARLTFLSTAVCAACLCAIAVGLEPRLLPQSLSGAAALLALALISQVGGQGLLAVALGTLPATFSSLVIFLEAIAAAGFGWIIFGEALGPIQAAGGIFILAGIWVARPRKETSNPPHWSHAAIHGTTSSRNE